MRSDRRSGGGVVIGSLRRRDTARFAGRDRPVTPGRVAVITVRQHAGATVLLCGHCDGFRCGSRRSNRRQQRIERRIDGALARIAAADGRRLSRMRPTACTALRSPRPCPSLPRESDLQQWVWVLDSDVVISRPDALKKALERADESRRRSWASRGGTSGTRRTVSLRTPF